MWSNLMDQTTLCMLKTGKRPRIDLKDRSANEYSFRPLKKKLPVAISLAYVTLTAAFGSSIFSAATGTVSKIFGISTEVGILGTKEFV